MNELLNCSVCSRAVRARDSECPFCGTKREATTRSAARRSAPSGLSRAAIFALGLTGLANAACYGGPAPSPKTPGSDVPDGALPSTSATPQSDQ